MDDYVLTSNKNKLDNKCVSYKNKLKNKCVSRKNKLDDVQKVCNPFAIQSNPY